MDSLPPSPGSPDRRRSGDPLERSCGERDEHENAALAYNVARRTRELGLRLALGADAAGLRTLVVRQVARVALIGAGIGLVLGVAAGRVAEAFLYGLKGHDPAVLTAVLAVLATVVAVAAYLPARRASRLAPMQALRYE